MGKWSVSKCSRDPAGQYEFFIPGSCLQTFSWFYCYWEITINIFISAISVFRLADNTMNSRLQIVHWPNYKLKPFAFSDRDTDQPLFVQHLACSSPSTWSCLYAILSGAILPPRPLYTSLSDIFIQYTCLYVDMLKQLDISVSYNLQYGFLQIILQ